MQSKGRACCLFVTLRKPRVLAITKLVLNERTKSIQSKLFEWVSNPLSIPFKHYGTMQSSMRPVRIPLFSPTTFTHQSCFFFLINNCPFPHQMSALWSFSLPFFLILHDKKKLKNQSGKVGIFWKAGEGRNEEAKAESSLVGRGRKYYLGNVSFHRCSVI